MEEREPRVAFVRRLFTRVEALGLYLMSGFLVCAVIVFLFGLLAREVFRTTDTREFDREVTLAVRELQSPSSDRIGRIVTFFGSHLFILPATVLITLLLRLRGHWVSALLFAGSVAGGFGLNALLKIAFARQRPDLWPALVAEMTYSFPSGHATMSTVFFGGLAAVVLHLSRRPVVRGATLALATTAILMIAASRVYLGAHWTTDVTGGILVGLFWVSVCSTGTRYVTERLEARVDLPVSRAAAPDV
jgi:undecaprenyl-diphosphatase